MLTRPALRRLSSVLAASALLGALTVPSAKGAPLQCRAWRVSRTLALPVGSYFQDTSGSSSTDVWAVGVNDPTQGSLIAHWDGSVWTSVDAHAPHTFLYGVVAISPSDAWPWGSTATPTGGSLSPGSCTGTAPRGPPTEPLPEDPMRSCTRSRPTRPPTCGRVGGGPTTRATSILCPSTSMGPGGSKFLQPPPPAATSSDRSTRSRRMTCGRSETR